MLHFSKNDYAAQNQTWAIDQTDFGEMVFANNAGFLEFNGSRWCAFPLPTGQVMRSVAYLGGRIFVGGFAEFGFFEKNTASRWQYHSLSAELGDDATARSEEIWHILTREKAGLQEVFFQSFSKIYRFDGQKTVRIDPPANLMFLQKVGEKILFQVIGGGIFELLPSGAAGFGASGFRFLEGTEAISATNVAFILPRKNDGSLLIGTKNDGLFVYKKGVCAPWVHPLNAVFKASQLNKAVRLSKKLPDNLANGFAIGTILSGVFMLDSLENERFHLDQSVGLQNNTVLSMHADRDGNLWLGLDKGIDCVELNAPWRWFSDISGRIGTVYSAALFEGNLYVGTNRGVFSKPWNRLKTAQSRADFQLVSGTQGQVWALQVFENQLICGHNEGTFLIKNPRSVRQISEVTGGWATIQMPEKSGFLIQGTYTGLIVFAKNKVSGAWEFSHRVEGFREPIKKMAFDSADFLRLTHPNRGVFLIKLSENLTRVAEIHAENAPEKTTQLPNFTFYEPSGGVFTAFSDEVFYEKNSTAKSTFPFALVPNWENIVLLAPDLFLFCLEDGYAIWDKKTAIFPENILKKERPIISAVEFLSGAGGWFFPKIAGNQSKLRFKSWQNDLRFYFQVPIFGKKMHWNWRLIKIGGMLSTDKFESNWATQSMDFVELTNLKSGLYQLDFSENGSETSYFLFEIQSPWYQRWWAFLLWAGLGLVVLLLIEKINRRRLARQKWMLEKEKLQELATQKATAETEFLQTELHAKARDLSNSTLNLIRKNEILLELKTELEATNLPDRDRERLNRLIDANISSDQDWAVFEAAFNEIHDQFFKKLKLRWPELTPGDLRLAAFLKLNLSSKEVAALQGLSVRGIENKRYRLRKKLGLSDVENLTEFVMRF